MITLTTYIMNMTLLTPSTIKPLAGGMGPLAALLRALMLLLALASGPLQTLRHLLGMAILKIHPVSMASCIAGLFRPYHMALRLCLSDTYWAWPMAILQGVSTQTKTKNALL